MDTVRTRHVEMRRDKQKRENILNNLIKRIFTTPQESFRGRGQMNGNKENFIHTLSIDIHFGGKIIKKFISLKSKIR